MKKEVDQAFGNKKEDQQAQTPEVPAPDLQAMLAAAKKAQEDLANELRAEAERKAAADAFRRKMIVGGILIAVLVLAAIFKRLL